MKLIFVFQSMRKGSGICIMARNLVEIPLQIACEAKVANITSSYEDMGLKQVPITVSARTEGQRCVEVETRSPIH